MHSETKQTLLIHHTPRSKYREASHHFRFFLAPTEKIPDILRHAMTAAHAAYADGKPTPALALIQCAMGEPSTEEGAERVIVCRMTGWKDEEIEQAAGWLAPYETVLCQLPGFHANIDAVVFVGFLIAPQWENAPEPQPGDILVAQPYEPGEETEEEEEEEDEGADEESEED